MDDKNNFIGKLFPNIEIPDWDNCITPEINYEYLNENISISYEKREAIATAKLLADSFNNALSHRETIISPQQIKALSAYIIDNKDNEIFSLSFGKIDLCQLDNMATTLSNEVRDITRFWRGSEEEFSFNLLNSIYQFFIEKELLIIAGFTFDSMEEEVSEEKTEGSEGIKVVAMDNNPRRAGRRVIPFYELVQDGLLQPLTDWIRKYIGDNEKFAAAIRIALDNNWLRDCPSYRSLNNHFTDIKMSERAFRYYKNGDANIRKYTLISVQGEAINYGLINR